MDEKLEDIVTIEICQNCSEVFQDDGYTSANGEYIFCCSQCRDEYENE